MLALKLIFDQIHKEALKYAKFNKLTIEGVEFKSSYMMFDIIGYRSDIELIGSVSVFYGGSKSDVTIISRLDNPITGGSKSDVVNIDFIKFDTNDVIKEIRKMFS